jgi:hypothetical protein
MHTHTNRITTHIARANHEPQAAETRPHPHAEPREASDLPHHPDSPETQAPLSPLLTNILDDYLDGDLSLLNIAERNNISLRRLLAILETPEVTALLDNLTAAAQRHARRLVAIARPAAIARLRTIAAEEPDATPLTARQNETARKAAAHLERLSRPKGHPATRQTPCATAVPAAPPEAKPDPPCATGGSPANAPAPVHSHHASAQRADLPAALPACSAIDLLHAEMAPSAQPAPAGVSRPAPAGLPLHLDQGLAGESWASTEAGPADRPDRYRAALQAASAAAALWRRLPSGSTDTCAAAASSHASLSSLSI